MKLGSAIVLCAATAIGTAIALDKVTGGFVKESISDMMIDHGLGMKDDFNDDNFDDFENPSYCTPSCDGDCTICDIDGLEKDMTVLYKGKNTPNVVIVPFEDAVNLYEMIEDAVGRLSDSMSDIEVFGDKAISFERLYDALEETEAIGGKKSDEVIKTDDELKKILTTKPNTEPAK